MIDEKKLRRFMATLIELLKLEAEDYLALSTEVAAMRDMLQELSDGRFLPRLQQYRRAAQDRGAVARLNVLRGYDELIRELEDGSAF